VKPVVLRVSRVIPTVVATFVLITAGCARSGDTSAIPRGDSTRTTPSGPASPPLFQLLDPNKTGVRFANNLPEAPDFNIINYLYYYNGGGVAVGDVNNDGLPDLYFSANLGSNTLYLNKGNYAFEDVTTKAGVAGPEGWKTGVTMADVNGDGFTDIYVSAVSYLSMHGHNVLYMNNGDGTFTDKSKETGLDHVGYSTQSTFFDYDGDGDLDLFLLSHSTHTERAIGSALKRDVRSPLGGGRLYRNDRGHFVDVSAKAGIFGGIEGFGLGVVASDLDGDGWMDLYVSNDFQENDFLYHNNGNGTFTESITTATKHTSRFSMGVDAADFNNDGRPDIVVADMMPEREDVLKTSANAEGFNLFNLRLQAGYHPQYARNTLQLNRGDRRFSEIGYFAGVYATDWSWSTLFADLDNDGKKDLFITSGIYRRPNDLDYINYVGNATVQASLANGVTAENIALLKQMPQVPVANHVFRNDGGLHFTDVAGEWGVGQRGFSNGGVYVDLNNSGALDLVINNINVPATIYRNDARLRNGNAYLSVQLTGEGANTAGIGAKLIAKQRGALQLVEQSPTRGFQSSVDTRLHFGFGKDTTLDSLMVIWPDRRVQVLTNVALNQTITLNQRDATGRYRYDLFPIGAPTNAKGATPLFSDITAQMRLPYKHDENSFNDLDREPLMPRQLSAEGPALAVADVNGDGLDDFYAGGGKWQRGVLMVQQRDGTFRESPEVAIAADSLSEDVDALFFDANGDNHPDLYVVSGGNEFSGEDDAMRDRLYINDGSGHFRRVREALPDVFENGSVVTAGDFNGDGKPDLFVGARVVTGKYGMTPRSHLLQNDGQGKFIDVTDKLAPTLSTIGMVTSATWTDYDGDGKLDLIVVGEWMPVTAFHQEKGAFVNRTLEAGFANSEGWWNSVTAADVDGDGRAELILGNLGRNSYITASATEPVRMYVSDFGNNGSLEQVITFFKHGVSYPIAGRDELVKLLPALRPKYQSFAQFGASRVEDIFSPAEIAKATSRVARTFSSAIAHNNGVGKFTLESLPVEAQLFPVHASIVRDFDGDGKADVLLAGNFSRVPPVQGRYDAGYGSLLRGDGRGTFSAVDMRETQLVIDGDVKHLAVVKSARLGALIMVARNNQPLQVIRMRSLPQ